MAIDTTMNFWHVNRIGQHFCLAMSCMQLNCSRESNKVLEEKNPIRKVQDLIKWYQAWRLKLHTHTHTRPSHAHCTEDSWYDSAAQTNMTQFEVRRPSVAWQLSPDDQRQALHHFCWVTTLWPAAELATCVQCISYSGSGVCVSRREGVLEKMQVLKSLNSVCFIRQLKEQAQTLFLYQTLDARKPIRNSRKWTKRDS